MVDVTIARNIKGAHFAVGCDCSYHYLPGFANCPLIPRGEATGFSLACPARPRKTVNVEKLLELFSPRRLKATQITRKLIGVEDVPHCGLKPWKLGGKLRMPLCRISKVHELLPDQIVECALDAKSPFDAAGRPALLYPDLVELYAAHVATIRVGLSRAQKKCAISFVRGLRSKRRILLISLMNFLASRSID